MIRRLLRVPRVKPVLLSCYGQPHPVALRSPSPNLGRELQASLQDDRAYIPAASSGKEESPEDARLQ